VTRYLSYNPPNFSGMELFNVLNIVMRLSGSLPSRFCPWLLIFFLYSKTKIMNEPAYLPQIRSEKKLWFEKGSVDNFPIFKEKI
jgi:hypothetical protein